MSKGLSSVKTLSAKEIAKKHDVSLTFILKQLATGVKVEREHTKDVKTANEIARDHLNERPDYYEKLGKLEKSKVSLKEETTTIGVGGLGFTTGTPAINDDNGYVSTNSLAYDPTNGARLDFIKKIHSRLHKNLGFNEYNPTNIKGDKNTVFSTGETALKTLGGDIIQKYPLDLKEGARLEKLKKAAKVGAVVGALGAHGAKIAGAAYDVGNVVHSKDPGVTVGTAIANLHPASRVALSAPSLFKATPTNKDENEFARQKKYGTKIVAKEDLRKWFREKWVRYDTKGNIKGPCAREEGEGKPKCRPAASARAMSKTERAKSARRKRREDPVADRPGKGGKPIMVKTNEETLLEKNVPTNPGLWARAKAQAKAKFDVYPSAYANGWASKWYKSKGGGWKSAANESVDEACWDGYQAKGMKKKGNKMVPNCVPVKEGSKDALPTSVDRGIYEISDTLVGKVSNARFWRGEAPSEILSRYIKRAQLRTPKKKEHKKKEIKEYANVSTNEYTKPYMTKSLVRNTRTSHEHISKPDTIEEPGRGGKTIYETKETTMDTKDHINEALDNILENNLGDMKENFMAALQEKAIEKLEERKKEIAANYFAQ